ncbi:TlpA family protein disulfide reductase [Chitinophaga silvatica]|uniref:TlpA family protein disulfide reductase n=1 Tax=Chitinophaga silvatica TaxID=2282649 RepID=A0A3E1Y5J9_9BACT|nr:TlpA disulfide reductase family protein [Chitinophaga silvatica]RFS20005.1 TlpA family protein disulfide reductase [Chitinophaga silvatica]
MKFLNIFFFNNFLISFVYIPAFGQKIMNIILVTDSSVNSKHLTISYNNGKAGIIVTDSFKNNKLQIIDSFFSEKVTFHISLRNELNNSNSSIFFVTSNPSFAKVSYNKNNKKEPLQFSYTKNIEQLNERHPIYHQLLKYRMKEATAFSTFWKCHEADIKSNDSINSIFISLFKAMNNKCIAFIEQHPNDYVSFWYFKDQIITSSIAIIPNDKEYLLELQKKFSTVFPKKYTQNTEGKMLLQTIDASIKPITVSEIAPLFEATDIRNQKQNLVTFKGKFVLLDFWASWCIPCLQEMNIIKSLRQKYSIEQLEIISITSESEKEKALNAISKNKMDWINIWDKYNEIGMAYKISYYPTLVLIDREGVVQYYHIGLGDGSEIEKIINAP